MNTTTGARLRISALVARPLLGLLLSGCGADNRAAGPPLAEPVFEILSAPDQTMVRTRSLSADGSVVGGSGLNDTISRALLWDTTGALRVLAPASTAPFGGSTVQAISADGKVLAGASGNGIIDAPQPAIWRLEDDSARLLASPPGAIAGHATDVSADGTVLLGTMLLEPTATARAVLWRTPEAQPEILEFDDAHALSPDGQTAALCCLPATGLQGQVTDAVVDLRNGASRFAGVPTGFDVCTLSALADTDRAVGTCMRRGAAGTEPESVPVVWNALVPEVITAISGQKSGVLTSLSADGQVAGGYSGLDPFAFEDAHAIVWSESRGAVRLADVLSQAGIAPAASFQLNAVLGVSADGQALIGVAFDRRDPEHRPLPFRVRGLRLEEVP